MKRRFQMAACTHKREYLDKIPKAADIKANAPPCLDVVSPWILDQIGDPKLAIGVDIETHGWPESSFMKGHLGQFGFYTMKDEASLQFSRIVQIGWVIGECQLDSHTVSKCYLVRPCGFQIEQKATHFHGISTELAISEGGDLKDVLNEFMNDVVTAFESGGTLTAHQIEFDGGVIYEELGRCGFTDLQIKWKTIVKKGFCTMNPYIGRWLLMCHGKEVGPDTVQHTIRLNELAKMVLPTHKEIKQHDAECDR